MLGYCISLVLCVCLFKFVVLGLLFWIFRYWILNFLGSRVSNGNDGYEGVEMAGVRVFRGFGYGFDG